MAVEVRIPSLGESVSQGVISKWMKNDGDLVDVDEMLFELETDKAAMEIPAEISGALEILVPEGAEVSVGMVVGRITEGKTASGKKSPDEGDSKAPVTESGTSPEVAAIPDTKPAGFSKVGPAARKLMAEHAVAASDVEGTGRAGRVTKADVLAKIGDSGVDSGEAPPVPKEAVPPPKQVVSPQPSGSEGVERVKMSRLRSRIAERLVEAQRTAAILTTFNEVDLSSVMALRKEHKERFREVHGVGLGFMSLFGRAVVLALRETPIVNAQVEGDEIVYHNYVHLGIAVGTERGLVVPVIRDADQMTIAGLEQAIGELAGFARDGKLLPDHLSGGTFTISNGGVYGSLLSTPILNPPQSGILGMHKIEERPVVINGEIVIRPMMYLALSYDHRLVDGEQAVTFLVRVKERLEAPARMLLEV